MKILSIVGARPQFVKMAVVSRELEKQPGFEHLIVHTGQHFDQGMSEVFFREMQIPEPAFNLGINQLSHGAMTGRMMEAIEEVCKKVQPSALLVFGDTNSTLAGALVASKLHIPLAHVEAGLRSFNMRMPEEVNRVLTDRVSDFLYCPSLASLRNLKAEGFDNFKTEMVLSGDVMYDAVKFYAALAVDQSSIEKYVDRGEDFVLCTLHRQENTDDPERLQAIVNSMNRLSERMKVIVPLHPRTAKMIEQQGLKLKVRLTEPLGYFTMLALLKSCRLVMTDSGGLQKEAYFMGKPCITLRDETEWTELVELGVNRLTGADTLKIEEALEAFLPLGDVEVKPIYGDGNAARKIVDHLAGRLG